MNTNDLLKLQKQIADSKTEGAQLEGERNAILKQLETDFGCKTIKQAEKKEVDMETEIGQLNAEIEKGLEELAEKYDL